MLTVRFPNGQAIQYNSATRMLRNDDGSVSLLRVDGDKTYTQAVVIGPCVVEFVTPCRVYNPIEKTGDVVGWLIDHARSLPYNQLGKLGELKRVLADFNIQRREWMR